MADQIYTFDHTGATKGAVTGRTHRFAAGQPVTAPEGEFVHMAGTYRTAMLQPGSAPLPPDPAATNSVSEADPSDLPVTAPDRRISAGGGGWYALTEGGIEVGKVRGEEAARAWQQTGEMPAD